MPGERGEAAFFGGKGGEKRGFWRIRTGKKRGIGERVTRFRLDATRKRPFLPVFGVFRGVELHKMAVLYNSGRVLGGAARSAGGAYSILPIISIIIAYAMILYCVHTPSLIGGVGGYSNVVFCQVTPPSKEKTKKPFAILLFSHIYGEYIYKYIYSPYMAKLSVCLTRVITQSIITDEVKQMLIEKLIARGSLYELENAFELIRDQEQKTEIDGEVQFTPDFYEAHERNKLLRHKVLELIKSTGEGIDLYYKTLLFDAPYDFDSYCLYLEHKRERSAQFYINRRKQLRTVVEALQGLADDEYDLVTISLPPGVGKSTLALLYLTWRAGRNPSKSILGVSHSTEFVAQAYKECLRFITSPEYCWSDVFPKVPLVSKNAEYQRIDLGTAKRFETLEFTSTDSKNAGMFRAQQLLYCDDLVSDQEQALSTERMDKLWESVYSVDIEQRRQGRPGELHIATRWSVHDVIGRLQEINEGNPRAKFIQVNALDENGESNFDYPYNLGFSTEAYHRLKEVMDDASWSALYMNEPYERKGLLYPVDRLRRFTELPGEPDGVVSVCDTKAKGSDYCVMPVAYLYGRDCYIADVVCDNGDPGQVETALVNMLLKHKVKRSRFESNAAGWKIADSVSDRVKEAGGYCSVETKWSQSNKETKIQVEQPWVVDHCLFLTDDKQSPQYKTFMKYLCSYVQNGKNKHDDVPDAMAQLSQFVQGVGGSKAQIVRRPF